MYGNSNTAVVDQLCNQYNQGLFECEGKTEKDKALEWKVGCAALSSSSLVAQVVWHFFTPWAKMQLDLET